MNNGVKKIILILVLILGILVSGIFTVDERQNAVVTNRITGQTRIYATGLHFAWPLLTQIRYVFINQRVAAFNFKLTLLDKTEVVLTSIVFWKVTKPALFLQNSISMTQTGFNQELSDKVKQIIAKQSFSLDDFNQHSILLDQIIPIDNLGIALNNITTNEISVVSHNLTPAIESGVLTRESVSLAVESVGDVEKVESIPADVNTLAIESAYYQAQAIKTQAQIEQAKMYREIQVKDPKFYDYFRKLQIYENSAKSKQEMPALQDLYSN